MFKKTEISQFYDKRIWLKRIKKYWLHFLFVTALIFLIFFIYRDYGIAWDEPYYANYGRDFVNSLFNLLNLKTNLTVVKIDTKEMHLKGHGVIFDILITLSTLFFKNFNFESFHLIKALFALPTFIFIGLVVNNFFGPEVSLGSMLLLALFPKFFGDMFNNSIDTMTTLSTALIIAFFVYYQKSNKDLIKKLGLALVTAVGISQRIVLGYLFILSLLTILIIDLSQKKSLKKIFSEILLIFLATILFWHLSHPYLLKHPIKGIYDQLMAAKNYAWTATVLFEGRRIWAYDLPWYYLPKLLLITSPLMTLFLFFLGVYSLIKHFFQEKNDPVNKWLYFYFLMAFFIPVFLVVWLRPTLYDSWRQMLFLTVPIIIIASFGLAAILNIKIKLVKMIFLILIVSTMIYTGWEMSLYHPYEYIYFNQLVGGVKNAYKDYETEYNCLSYKEAVGWLAKHTKKNQVIYRIFVVGEPFTASYYFPKNFYLTDDLNQADYLISLTRWDLHLAFPGEPIHLVTHLGVPMTYIKKLR
ncbi:MAG: glycosyltransferase family 39 protein [Microgenomates group bacterium]|nr:glycosyltransferase family 39 protein [Microgenomates group bacterium]